MTEGEASNVVYGPSDDPAMIAVAIPKAAAELVLADFGVPPMR